MSRDLARALAEGLHRAGVAKIFGMPGGGPNLDMIGSAQELGIAFILTHGETAACIMAATYGRLTDTVGAAVVTRGPGFSSASTGMAQATLDRFPLLVISDCVSGAHARRIGHQRLDQVAAAAPLTKWSGTIGTVDPAGLLTAASRLATAAPAGAVHLAFDPTGPGDTPPEVPVFAPTNATGFETAHGLLTKAGHLVVLVGLDAGRHVDDVRAALQALDCPILVTYEAKGTIPESWPTYAGLFTGAAIEAPVLDQADVVLAVGLDPVEPLPTGWPYRARVVTLSTHPVETAYFGAPLSLIGGYREHLPRLLDGCQPDWPSAAGSEIRKHDLARLEAHTDGLSPHDVVRTTAQVLGGSLLTVDAGAHMLVAMPLWGTDEAGTVLISNGLATMGFSLPAAIGAAIARPGQRVVCFVGDGGLGMVLAELETLARLRLPVTVVVFNDATLNLIKLKQGEGQGGAGAVGYGAIDFAAVAAAMGLPAYVAEGVDSLRAALSSADGGPALVDARIDPSGYPHVIAVTRG